MRKLVEAYFTQIMGKGETIKTRRLYSGIYSQFPEACERVGFTSSKPLEEKWKNKIRFGLRTAKDKGLIEHIGSPKSGLWKRI